MPRGLRLACRTVSVAAVLHTLVQRRRHLETRASGKEHTTGCPIQDLPRPRDQCKRLSAGSVSRT